MNLQKIGVHSCQPALQFPNLQVPSLRLQNCRYVLVEDFLKLSTEAVGSKLAEILTQYLRKNWIDTPASEREITPATNMVSDLQLDSFQVMEFMLEVEDHYDIAIDLESLSNVQTILGLAGVVIAVHNE